MDKDQPDPLFFPESMGELSSIATDASVMLIGDVENKLQGYQLQGPKDDTILILRAFLDNLPADGKRNLLDDIGACKSNDELQQHASSLVEGLLFPMRAHPKTPSVTTSPRFGLEDSVENIASELTESATRKSQRALKKACLSRDGNMCAITHLIEASSAGVNQIDVVDTDTECAHIIPFSLGSWTSNDEQFATSQIWVNLNRCFPSLRSRINFTQLSINDTRNAITMDRGLHFHFGRFNIALEATNQEHTYRIQNYKPNRYATHALPSSGFVTFVNHNNHHELPSPILLQVHATIARILHATGKAEQADKLLRDKDDIGVLAQDGGTDVAALLSATSLAPLSSRSPSSRNPSARPPSTARDGKAPAFPKAHLTGNSKKENAR